MIRFLDSELDLNDEIQKLHVIATVPHLYHHIVEVNAVGTILGLLSHENSGKYKQLEKTLKTGWPIINCLLLKELSLIAFSLKQGCVIHSVTLATQYVSQCQF